MIGIDILKKDRIKIPYINLANRVLTPVEFEIFENTKDKQSYLAKRFCAKEAISAFKSSQ